MTTKTTMTGRLSSASPNLQNIPVKKTKEGQAARRAFVDAHAAVLGKVPFSVIKHAVSQQFNLMKEHKLFRVDLSGASQLAHAVGGVTETVVSPEQRQAETGRILWEKYLAAFPEGTNPLYRERTDHDCACCRHFIRTMGGVVTIVNGALVSIWDFDATHTFYDDVANELSALVRNAAIDNIFLHMEKSVGVEKNFQQVLNLDIEGVPLRARKPPAPIVADGGVLTWEHFHLHLPTAVVMKKDAIGPKTSEARAAFDVLRRGLEELTLDSVDTVLELIDQNSLYRGAEHKAVLSEFRRLKVAYETMRYGMGQQDLLNVKRAAFVWSNINSFAARIRNTAIGTLLIDLSAGVDMEEAVRKFEAVVAPANYKRPTALVTKAMVEKARQKIEELGLTSALERRYANIDDITVNNILYVDRDTRTATMSKLLSAPYGKGKQFTGDDIFADLAAKVSEKPRSYDKVEEIGIEKFLSDVLPKALSLEVMLENRHAGNLVSLIAPADPGSKSLFKWPNKFSWSYAGDVADSLKERVKRAGGSVTGDLCCRLAWDYTDDLDFHMQEPASTRRTELRSPFRSYAGAPGSMASMYGNISSGSCHIFYGNVRRLSANGGMLDLDANGCDGMKEEPVENIFYADKANMAEGIYELTVNNYNRRSSDGKGFEVEVEFDGVTHSFVYEKVLRTGETVVVAEIEYSKANGFKILSSLPSTQASKNVWNLTTQQFHKVNAVMLSPNYWHRQDETLAFKPDHVGIGNKHWFFMLEGCANEGTARGFYNEFLSSELEPHRKVMEMVGARMRTEEASRQLSGLGFSSTQRSSLLCRIEGAFTRVVKVVF